MGWCSGTEIFDETLKTLFEYVGHPDAQIAIIKSLAVAMENHDWDCQSDSEYYDHPMVQRVFKELHPEWDDIDIQNEKIEKATNLIKNYGMEDGSHHKQWVLAKVLKILVGESEYLRYKAELEANDYEWDEGVAP